MTYFQDDEVQLEKLMLELGQQRYRSKLAKARAGGKETATAAGQYLLRVAVTALSEELRAWLKKSKTQAGARHSSAWYISQLDPDVVAFLTVRVVLDSIALSKAMAALCFSVGSALEDEARFVFLRKHAPLQWADLNRKLKVSSYSHKRKALRGALSKIEEEHPVWPKRERIKAGIILIELLRMSTDLVELQHLSDARGKTVSMLTATAKTLEWLEKSHAAHESMFPFYMPALQRPREWDNPFDGGYHTNLIARRPLVKSRDRQYLQTLEQTQLPEVYDAVNTLQGTAWELNPQVYAVMKEAWERDIVLADLPQRTNNTPPPKPHDIDTNQEARKAWRRAATQVYRGNVENRSSRIQTAKVLFMAEHFIGKRFFYPYQADFRGRLYPVPYFLQPQGPSQARGLLRFAEGKPLDPVAKRWLAIHGANRFGIDKVTMEERVAWVDAHAAEIRSYAADPFGNRGWTEADKPWEFLAFCFEWAQVLDGTLEHSCLPISLDGSNNGLQIFSLLLRDPIGAEATNCLDTGKPRDIYQDVADRVTLKLLESEDAIAARWLDFVNGRLPRECCKRPVMTLPYGATAYSCQEYVVQWYRAALKAKGEPWPQGGYLACRYLSAHVWSSIGETVTSARACMSWLQQVARICTQESLVMRWTSPSGFLVQQDYRGNRRDLIQTSIGDRVRKLKIRTETTKLCIRRQLNGISPNFVHSLDAAALVKTVNLCAARGISSFAMVHDSFGVPAADVDILARTLREVYAEMFSTNLLEVFRDEIQLQLGDRGTLPPLPQMGALDVHQVLTSTYFFA